MSNIPEEYRSQAASAIAQAQEQARLGTVRLQYSNMAERYNAIAKSKYDLDKYYEVLKGNNFTQYGNSIKEALETVSTKLKEIKEQTAGMNGITNSSLSEALETFSKEIDNSKSLVDDYTLPKCSNLDKLIELLGERENVRKSVPNIKVLSEGEIRKTDYNTLTRELANINRYVTSSGKISYVENKCDDLIDEISKISDGAKLDTNTAAVTAAATSVSTSKTGTGKQMVFVYDETTKTIKQVEVDSSVISDAKTYKLDDKTRSELYTVIGSYNKK